MKIKTITVKKDTRNAVKEVSPLQWNELVWVSNMKLPRKLFETLSQRSNLVETSKNTVKRNHFDLVSSKYMNHIRESLPSSWKPELTQAILDVVATSPKQNTGNNQQFNNRTRSKIIVERTIILSLRQTNCNHPNDTRSSKRVVILFSL